MHVAMHVAMQVAVHVAVRVTSRLPTAVPPPSVRSGLSHGDSLALGGVTVTKDLAEFSVGMSLYGSMQAGCHAGSIQAGWPAGRQAYVRGSWK